MKTAHLLFLASGLSLAAAGCVSTPEPAAPPPATQTEVNYLREEIRRMTARLDSSEAEIGRVQGDVMASRSSQPAYTSSAQFQSVQGQMDDLQRQIRALDAARAADKKEIYDDISKKIAMLLKSAPVAAAPRGAATAKPRTGAQSGIEHVVQPGESLSKIAAAYKVSMSVIVQENGLASPDSIRVGQKLFIPD